MEQSLERLADITLRTALGASRTVTIFGAQYAVAGTAFWKNEAAFPVAVTVEVTRAGPLGATVTVDGVPLPADTVGGRSAMVALDLNESLPIFFSDASIEARLVIRTPKSPML